jgi:Fe-S-cluster containining protein
LPYDAASVFKMADFLQLSIDEIINTYYGKMSTDGSYWKSEDGKRTPCPFLRISEERHFCNIYNVRPEGCRLYPIDTDSGRDGVDCPAWEIAFSKLRKEQEDDILSNA